jgi:hypothetical protein
MEKVLLSLTLSVLLLATTDSFAQDSKLGIRAGINLVSFSGVDAALINDQNAGFFAGFYYDYIYTDRIGVETGLTYSRTGSSDGSDSSAISIGYIEVPILFKYYITQSINIHVGPQFSLLSDAKFGDGNDATEFFKIGKTSFAFGAEYRTNFNLVINLRYNLGLSSIVATQTEYFGITDTSTKFDVKYNSLQVGIGYLF